MVQRNHQRATELCAEQLEPRMLLAVLMQVYDGATELLSSGTTLDFGTIIEGNAPSVKNLVFLSFNNFTDLAMTAPTNYQVGGDPLNAVVNNGAIDTFQIQLNTLSPGFKTGNVTVTGTGSDDYVFPVTGRILALPEVSTFLVGGGEVFDDNFPGDATNPAGASTVTYTTTLKGSAAPVLTFTVKNDGDLVMNLSTTGSTVIQVPAGYSLVSDLPTSIAPRSEARFSVQMDTAAVGVHTGQITFVNNDAGVALGDSIDETNFVFNVTGEVVGPEITIAAGDAAIVDGQAGAVNFGSANQLGSPLTQIFTVTNDGTSPLNLASLGVTGNGFTVVEGLTGVLQPGQSDTFTVQLATATAGNASGVVTIVNDDNYDNVNEQTFTFPVAGYIAAPEISVAAGSVAITDGQAQAVDFGDGLLNTAAPTVTFTITNTGDAPLVLGALSIADGFSLVTAYDATIQPGQATTLVVQMDTDSLGAQGGELSFITNDLNETPFNFPLTGQVIAPEIAVSVDGVAINDGQTTPISFGAIGVGQGLIGRTFTITNNGDSVLEMSNLVLPEGFTVISTVPESLAIGATTSIIVQMDSAVAGVKSGEFALTNSDTTRNPFNFAIEGEVLAVIAEGSSVSYVDAAGTSVTAKVTRGGTMQVFAAPTIFQGYESYSLSTPDSRSALTVTTRGGGSLTMLDAININGSLAKLNAKTTSLNASLNASESLGSVTLNNVADGAVLTSGAAATGKGFSFKGNQVGNASFDLAGDVNLFQVNMFTGGKLQASGGSGINRVVVKNGVLGASLVADNGGITNVQANNGISGDILALNNIGTVKASKGAIAGTIRGENIKAIIAEDLGVAGDGALISAADTIKKVQVANDVIDSHVLAGYDIGIDGLVGAGDTLSGGDINKFKFGGNFSNTNVAVGVIPIYSTLIPAPANGENSSGEQSYAKVVGDNVVANNNGQLFGFYFDSTAGSTLASSLSDSGDFRIVEVVNE